MRCQSDVIQPRQRVAFVEWLRSENIERRMPYVARLQSLDERRLVDEGPTRGIDQDCPTLHPCQSPRIQEPTRL